MRGSGRVLDRQPKYRGKRVCRCDRGEFTSGAAAAAHRARVGTHTRDAPRPGRLVRQSRGVGCGSCPRPERKDAEKGFSGVGEGGADGSERGI